MKESAEDVQIGKEYVGTVKRVLDFGAFVEILPNVEGFLHVSEIAEYRIEDIHEELKKGKVVPVRVMSIDQGQILLRRSVLLKKRDL